MNAKRKIIDAHAHIFPGKIAERASESIKEFYHLNMGFAGYPHTLIERGSRIGVYKYLVCSTATKPEQVFSINSFIAQKCEKYPQFFGFGSLHPHMEPEEYTAEILRIKQLGLHGIKLHSDFQQFDIDDPNMIPVYRLAAKAGLPILFHMGDSRYDYSAPRRLANAATEVPDLICLAAHFGGYERWDEAYQYLKLPNVYFDTSSSLFKLSKSDALAMMDDWESSVSFLEPIFRCGSMKRNWNGFLLWVLVKRITRKSSMKTLNVSFISRFRKNGRGVSPSVF